MSERTQPIPNSEQEHPHLAEYPNAEQDILRARYTAEAIDRDETRGSELRELGLIAIEKMGDLWWRDAANRTAERSAEFHATQAAVQRESTDKKAELATRTYNALLSTRSSAKK